MKYFLSCDWGTSNFRLRLVRTADLKVVAQEISGEGIASTFAAWQQSGHPIERRQSYYLEVIKRHIHKMELHIRESLSSVPVVISGMASSSIGFIDIPYRRLPLGVNGENIKTAFIPANGDFDHDVTVISGIRTDDDVIRGEETQLIGCIDPGAGEITNQLFIFPGTHSKHIHVINNQVVGFKTYMTGELFNLLSTTSLLKASVEQPDNLMSADNLPAFKLGVHKAADSNLLNAAFMVRTNDLFNKLSKQENFSYLSGLLIGTELKGLSHTNYKKINLVCGAALHDYYLCALNELGLSPIVQKFAAEWVDEAVVRGQYIIYKQSLI